MSKNLPTLLLFALLYTLALTFSTSTLSISGHEAKIFYEGSSFLHYLTKLSTLAFGSSEFGLRVPFIALHIVNSALLYFYARRVLKREKDSLLLIVTYCLMPGVLSSALLVSEAGIIIFCVLLYLLTMQNRVASTILLVLFVFIDNSFSLLFLALFFYATYKREGFLMLVSLLLFGLNMYLFGFDDGGKPRGYFLDTFGVFAIIFTPLVFIYFVYSLYRILIKETKSVLWFVSFVPFMFALLLSFRQKIVIEDFAPFLVLGTPLAVRTFLEAYRVRLPQYRAFYTVGTVIVFTSLVLLFLATIFNKPLYALYDDPKKHPAYHYMVIKELADKLNDAGIKRVDTQNRELALRLKFYGIDSGGELYLSSKRVDTFERKFEIIYSGNIVAEYYLLRKVGLAEQ